MFVSLVYYFPILREGSLGGNRTNGECVVFMISIYLKLDY